MAALVPGFTILQHLGRGAGSHIYRAKDLSSGKEVALKRVIRASEEDDKYLAQAEREYDVARRVDHPCLRRCYEKRLTREREVVRELLLVMELILGRTLENHRPREPLRSIHIFIGVARGLSALHEMGIVHCDVKPRNVMLCEDGTVKLIDYGQTCLIGTAKERVQGTPDFLAPEQVRLDRLDERTDVFGLGATMYWAVTGHGLVTPSPSASSDPWPSGDGGLLKWSGPTPPHKLRQSVPIELSELIMWACHERPNDRPAKVSEVVAALERLLPEAETGNDTASPSEANPYDGTGPSKLARRP